MDVDIGRFVVKAVAKIVTVTEYLGLPSSIAAQLLIVLRPSCALIRHFPRSADYSQVAAHPDFLNWTVIAFIEAHRSNVCQTLVKATKTAVSGLAFAPNGIAEKSSASKNKPMLLGALLFLVPIASCKQPQNSIAFALKMRGCFPA